MLYQDANLFIFHSLAYATYHAYSSETHLAKPLVNYPIEAADNKCGIARGYSQLTKLSPLSSFEKVTFAYEAVETLDVAFFERRVVFIGDGRQHSSDKDQHTVKLPFYKQQSRFGIYFHVDYFNSLLLDLPNLRLAWFVQLGVVIGLLLIGALIHRYWMLLLVGIGYIVVAGFVYGTMAILLPILHGMIALLLGKIVSALR